MNHSKKKTADKIREMVTSGQEINEFFTGKGRMTPGLPPENNIQRVTIDFTDEIVNNSDLEARRLNIRSRT